MPCASNGPLKQGNYISFVLVTACNSVACFASMLRNQTLNADPWGLEDEPANVAGTCTSSAAAVNRYSVTPPLVLIASSLSYLSFE
jgi:hypothetical protein